MQRHPFITKDGSHTISIPEWNVTYHSQHGAIGESMHVYIDAGLRYKLKTNKDSELCIFEMGFGTGLNILLTLMESEKTEQNIYYAAIEYFPLEVAQVNALNFCEQLNREDMYPVFQQIHQCEWEKDMAINPGFILHKINKSFVEYIPSQLFDLVYFDAFDPGTQQELWTIDIFNKVYNMLLPEGILVTYSSKADVRRAMQAVGFKVEKIPGPWGKREMLRARKVK